MPAAINAFLVLHLVLLLIFFLNRCKQLSPSFALHNLPRPLSCERYSLCCPCYRARLLEAWYCPGVEYYCFGCSFHLSIIVKQHGLKIFIVNILLGVTPFFFAFNVLHSWYYCNIVYPFTLLC